MEASLLAGHWEGAIQVPGSPLGVKIDLEWLEGVWQGTIDIPMQGAVGLALEEISWQDPEARFRIAGIPGSPTFEGRLEGSRLEGTFHQGGASFPFALSREVRPRPDRPQEPVAPFPYRSLEVSYPGPAGKIAGTLTLPEGREPIATVLLISGSGPQNRDGEIFEHRPFLVLADHLSRHGIAVLRLDDRGVGGSEGSFAGATSQDFAEDVRAGLKFLRAYPGLPKDRVGLLGHSEGGLIAPLLAAEDPRIAFLVLIAAPAVPGREVLARQRVLIARSAGEEELAIESREALFGELMDLLLGEEEKEGQRKRMEEIVSQQLGVGSSPEDRALAGGQVEAALAQLEAPWFRFFLSYDPRPALGRVKAPLLALYGAKDLQVDPEQNQGPLEEALRQAGNRDVEVVRLAGLNHLMQSAGTGHPSEYGALPETFAPAALERITAWILERFSPPPKGPATQGAPP